MGHRYFTHGEYAGVSAFVSKAAAEEDRNAHFVAVGVLVPLSYGRLGRAWMHAEGLRTLAGYVLRERHICRGQRLMAQQVGSGRRAT